MSMHANKLGFSKCYQDIGCQVEQNEAYKFRKASQQ